MQSGGGTEEAQPSLLDRISSKLPGSSETGLQGAVHHLGDTYKAVVKPLVDVSAPEIAHQIYRKVTGQANELHDLPAKMALAFFSAEKDRKRRLRLAQRARVLHPPLRQQRLPPQAPKLHPC